MDKDFGMIEPDREDAGREIMRTPDEVTAIHELQRKGWGAKRIARELRLSRNTVRRYVRLGGGSPTASHNSDGRLLAAARGSPSST